MRILQVFNRYLERGGEEMSVERISNVLGARHQVFHCYFDSAMWAGERSLMDSVRQVGLMFHNPDSMRRFRRHIRAARPDLLLLHNLFPVGSASVLRAAVATGLPVFQLVHNFRPFSVNGYLWAGDRLVTQGLKKNFLPEILAGSWQGSRAKTAVYAAVLSSMHASGIFKKVDGWLAISEFVARTFVEAGLPAEKVHVLKHSWDARPEAPAERPATPPVLLFLGRLTESKGVATLLDAWQRAADRVPGARLCIGGLGPLEAMVKERAAQLPRCDYLGFVDGARKSQLLTDCTAMVIPSVWWEALGLVSYEAYDFARPVLAADSGGLAETVEPDQTGWLHRPGDADQLADQMVAVLTNPAEAARRGAEGRRWLLEHTRREDWLDTFDRIVAGTLARKANA